MFASLAISTDQPFEVTNGIKQDCVMTPTLFSMMFSAILIDAFQDSDTVFPIRYRFDGNIFRKLQAKTKVQPDVLDEILYEDDMDKRMSAQRQKCAEPWSKSHSHVITMISQ